MAPFQRTYFDVCAVRRVRRAVLVLCLLDACKASIVSCERKVSGKHRLHGT